MRDRAQQSGADDRGAILVLVILFLLVGGLLVGALADAAVNDLHNSTGFKSTRNLNTAAESAINVAIQHIRYSPEWAATLNASPPGPCWSPGPSADKTNGNYIQVWCSTAWYPSKPETRVVTISACEYGVAVATCAAQPMLQAVVAFDDYPAGLTSPSTAYCTTYCGAGMNVESWVPEPVIPTVSNVGTGPNGFGAATGPVSGETTIVISGTGFIDDATTVNFVEESSPGVPASDNTVLQVPASSVQFVSSNQISVQTPAIIEGSTYFVTVSTPVGEVQPNHAPVSVGTSPYYSVVAHAYMVFKYTFAGAAPTLGPISPTTGDTSGGTAVTLNGTGFVNGAVVKFVETTNSAVVVSATSVTVVSPTEIIAVAPGVISGSTYYVQVTTPGGSTPTSSSDEFTYILEYPEVSSISPTSGYGPTASTTGTSVTLTGSNFYSGATVCFVDDNQGTATGSLIQATSIDVVSPTEITVNAPVPSGGSAYFVLVNTTNLVGASGGYSPGCPSSPPTPNSGGMSEALSNAVFSYVPIATSISPTTGSDPYSNGNVNITTVLTVNGVGFSSPATVSFTPESGGTVTGAPSTATASNVASNGNSLTVNVPSVSSGSTYFVSVSTSGGASAVNSSDPVFTYEPTVTSISPSSGSNANSLGSTVVSGYLFAGVTNLLLEPTGCGSSCPSMVTVPSSDFVYTAGSGSSPSTIRNITVPSPYLSEVSSGHGSSPTTYVIVVEITSTDLSTSAGTAGIDEYTFT